MTAADLIDHDQDAIDWIRPEIRALNAYAVADATGLIKLDAMENPYPWPEPLQATLRDRLAEVAINRYPDPAGQALKAQLRATLGIADDIGILLGNGSDELIQCLALAVAQPGRRVMAPAPSFVMYQLIAEYAGLTYRGVPLQADFDLDLDALLAAIAAESPALLFLSYPNNPTGNAWPRSAIEALIAAGSGLVVVDEAYAPFATDSFLPDLGRYPNLLVLRTVSKMGLAGLRLGYLCGPAALIAEIDKVRLPYNINALTQAAVTLALAHQDLFAAQAAAIRAERERLFTALAALPGLTPYPSQANFILLRTPVGQARPLFEGLRQSGILIKDLSANGGLLTDCLRITVGTPQENDLLLATLARLMATAGG